MVTGNEILNYQGNVGLGLNSDGIGSYGETDTKDLSNAVFNMAYLNLQKNKEIWNQKIKDRDEAMNLIASDRLKIDNVLPNHREELSKQIDEIKKIYYDNGGDIKSDPRLWLEINDKLSKFQSANVMAKTSLDTYTKGMTETAGETDPIKKKRMLDWWKTQSQKKATEIFDPYQKTFDWHTAVALPDMAMKESASRREGDSDVTDKITDTKQAYLEYLTAFQNNDKGADVVNKRKKKATNADGTTAAEQPTYTEDDLGSTVPNVQGFYDANFGLDGLSDTRTVEQRVTKQNEALMKIAQLEGYKTATAEDLSNLPVYLKPIKMAVNPVSGKMEPLDTVPTAAFKAALVVKYQHGQDRVPNKLYSEIDKNKAEIGKLNSESASARAQAAQRRSFIPYNQARAKYWNNKGTQTENENKLVNTFGDTMARSKMVNFFKTDPKTNLKIPGTDQVEEIVLVSDMPEGFSKVLAGANQYGKPIPLLPLKDKGGVPYYKVVKSPFYVAPGTDKTPPLRYSEAQLERKFNDIPDKFKKDNKINTVADLINYLGEKNGLKQDKEFQGANGRGTYQSTMEGLRIQNNQSRGGKTDEVLSQQGDNNLDQTQ